MTTKNQVNTTLSGQTGTGSFVGSDSPTMTTPNVDEILHTGDTNNRILFGTDTQSYETGGSSRMDISDSGVRMGGANARVTTILDEDNMASDSATALATQASIKAYADTKIKSVNIKYFTSSGTYTPTAGMVFCLEECWGGGGAGGGTASSTGNSGGGGGGAGGYSAKLSTAADIGASKAVTIGAGGTPGSAGNNPGGNGGDTSVGSLCIAKGGSGGSGAGANLSGAPGVGGVAGTGDLTLVGSEGSWSPSGSIATIGFQKPAGGVTTLGGQVSSNGGGIGISASANTGNGGEGGMSLGNSIAVAGGAGGSGFVRITEFIAG